MPTQRHERLTALPGHLRSEGYSKPPPYRVIREKAVDAVIPAHQQNGIWHYRPTHVATIAEALGLERTDDGHDARSAA
jgi:hypothetical protein